MDQGNVGGGGGHANTRGVSTPRPVGCERNCGDFLSIRSKRGQKGDKNATGDTSSNPDLPDPRGLRPTSRTTASTTGTLGSLRHGGERGRTGSTRTNTGTVDELRGQGDGAAGKTSAMHDSQHGTDSEGAGHGAGIAAATAPGATSADSPATLIRRAGNQESQHESDRHTADSPSRDQRCLWVTLLAGRRDIGLELRL